MNTQISRQTDKFFKMLELCRDYLSLRYIWLYVAIVERTHFTSLHSCLNAKGLLTWNRRNIWSWSDCNEIRTINHLVYKQTCSQINVHRFNNNNTRMTSVSASILNFELIQHVDLPTTLSLHLSSGYLAD